jgi:predicted N-acyltransferase
MRQFNAAEWDALAGSQPFLKHAFLDALETSGCVTDATGWQPRHLGLWRGKRLAAAMPLYLKSHSYGEYVFDWRWADAYEQAGGSYFPKLLCAVPFTPVPGPRLLAANGSDRLHLLEAVLELAREGGLSSFHCLFPDSASNDALSQAGLMQRQGYQFHWPNPGYGDFDEFLATLSHHKRKKIRQERRKILDASIGFEIRTGSDIRESDWAFFHQCYVHTYRLHHSNPYLNLEFFLRLGEALPNHTMMVLGSRHGQPVSAALNLYDNVRLYGRYWGTLEFVPGLHFETCYYQGMEFCIRENLKIFEGGAQGEHKLARGFLPVVTHSWHWLTNGYFGKLISDFLARESLAVENYLSELEGPYRREQET